MAGPHDDRVTIAYAGRPLQPGTGHDLGWCPWETQASLWLRSIPSPEWAHGCTVCAACVSNGCF